jgi:hypothetical protein
VLHPSPSARPFSTIEKVLFPLFLLFWSLVYAARLLWDIVKPLAGVVAILPVLAYMVVVGGARQLHWRFGHWRSERTRLRLMRETDDAAHRYFAERGHSDEEIEKLWPRRDRKR